MPTSMNEKREAARGTTDRNRAIVGAYCDGVKGSEIASQHGVSTVRVKEIVGMYKLRALRGKMKS